MLNILFVAVGGALGTALRYFVSGIDYKVASGAFPVNTMLINLSGSLIIGFLWGVFEGSGIPPLAKIFIFIGVLGGFTTFSAFSLENFNLLRDGQYKIALINILFTNILGIVFVFVGFIVSKLALNIIRITAK